MRGLVDAQAVLWHMNGDARLPINVREWLASAENTRIFSAVSAWEIIIKGMSGKMQVDRPPAKYVAFCIEQMVMDRLPITFEHVAQVAELPRYHGDPFDRLLVAQAQVENLPIITGDVHIARYGVEIIW